MKQTKTKDKPQAEIAVDKKSARPIYSPKKPLGLAPQTSLRNKISLNPFGKPSSISYRSKSIRTKSQGAWGTGFLGMKTKAQKNAKESIEAMIGKDIKHSTLNKTLFKQSAYNTKIKTKEQAITDLEKKIKSKAKGRISPGSWSSFKKSIDPFSSSRKLTRLKAKQIKLTNRKAVYNSKADNLIKSIVTQQNKTNPDVTINTKGKTLEQVMINVKGLHNTKIKEQQAVQTKKQEDLKTLVAQKQEVNSDVARATRNYYMAKADPEMQKDSQKLKQLEQEIKQAKSIKKLFNNQQLPSIKQSIEELKKTKAENFLTSNQLFNVAKGTTGKGKGSDILKAAKAQSYAAALNVRQSQRNVEKGTRTKLNKWAGRQDDLITKIEEAEKIKKDIGKRKLTSSEEKTLKQGLKAISLFGAMQRSGIPTLETLSAKPEVQAIIDKQRQARESSQTNIAVMKQNLTQKLVNNAQAPSKFTRLTTFKSTLQSRKNTALKAAQNEVTKITKNLEQNKIIADAQSIVQKTPRTLKEFKQREAATKILYDAAQKAARNTQLPETQENLKEARTNLKIELEKATKLLSEPEQTKLKKAQNKVKKAEKEAKTNPTPDTNKNLTDKKLLLKQVYATSLKTLPQETQTLIEGEQEKVKQAKQAAINSELPGLKLAVTEAGEEMSKASSLTSAQKQKQNLANDEFKKKQKPKPIAELVKGEIATKAAYEALKALFPTITTPITPEILKASQTTIDEEKRKIIETIKNTDPTIKNLEAKKQAVEDAHKANPTAATKLALENAEKSLKSREEALFTIYKGDKTSYTDAVQSLKDINNLKKVEDTYRTAKATLQVGRERIVADEAAQIKAGDQSEIKQTVFDAKLKQQNEIKKLPDADKVNLNAAKVKRNEAQTTANKTLPQKTQQLLENAQETAKRSKVLALLTSLTAIENIAKANTKLQESDLLADGFRTEEMKNAIAEVEEKIRIAEEDATKTKSPEALKQLEVAKEDLVKAKAIAPSPLEMQPLEVQNAFKELQNATTNLKTLEEDSKTKIEQTQTAAKEAKDKLIIEQEKANKQLTPEMKKTLKEAQTNYKKEKDKLVPIGVEITKVREDQIVKKEQAEIDAAVEKVKAEPDFATKNNAGKTKAIKEAVNDVKKKQDNNKLALQNQEKINAVEKAKVQATTTLLSNRKKAAETAPLSSFNKRQINRTRSIEDLQNKEEQLEEKHLAQRKAYKKGKPIEEIIKAGEEAANLTIGIQEQRRKEDREKSNQAAIADKFTQGAVDARFAASEAQKLELNTKLSAVAANTEAKVTDAQVLKQAQLNEAKIRVQTAEAAKVAAATPMAVEESKRLAKAAADAAKLATTPTIVNQVKIARNAAALKPINNEFKTGEDIASLFT
jgi:hypothetical protein